MVIVSAPGKVHLIGEHAVVAGCPAILAAVGQRTTVACTLRDDVRYHDMRFPKADHTWSVDDVLHAATETKKLWNGCKEKNNFLPVIMHVKKNGFEAYRKSIVGIVLAELGITQGVDLMIRSDVPVGSGLGSSSSLAVALTQAIAAAANKNILQERVNAIAYELEKIIHGMPSGGDNAACCYGGLVWFQRATPQPIIKSLRDTIIHPLKNFVLVYTIAPKKTTGELVQMVRDLDPAFRTPIFERIRVLVDELITALKDDDMQTVIAILNETHEHLKAIGISVPEVDKLHDAIKKIGGGSKICGGGGGGVMLCWHEDKQKLLAVIKEHGYMPLETELGAPGVRVEQ
ncbi:MAG: mevalonate kinase [Candidatus Aenigmarchaeota archaeon]|nr:mevalonate kinase [Candidatus Aenigmarchaeota archaeon]